MGEVHGERTPPVCCRTVSSRPPPRVLLLCSACMGHLIPFTELARRLVSEHGLAATILFAAATSPPSDQFLALAASVPPGVDLVALPAPPDDDDDDAALLSPPRSTAHLRDRVARAVRRSVPRVHELARGLAPQHQLAALVVDMVGPAPAVRDVAAELGVPLYVFFTSPWMTLSLFLHLPDLDAAAATRSSSGSGEFRDAKDPIRLPGCVPIHARDLPPSMLADRSSDAYAGFVAMARNLAAVDGVLVNTFGDAVTIIGDGTIDDDGLPPVHPVGPLVWTRPVVGTFDGDQDDRRRLTWLDRQPPGSVVYVSFGSGGTLTSRQTTELALGLELSQCRYLWAVRRPDQTSTAGAFFGTTTSTSKRGDQRTDLDFLPEGFVERTGETGLVTLTWAPQTAVLAHASVGCFVTHCGWNSILESVTNGVPMVAWPLYAEQSMNAAMLEDQVGVAVRVKFAGADDDRFVSREEVATAIRRAMEGEEAERMRKRASELRERSARALSENGCSTRVLAQTANKWKSLLTGNESKC